MLEDAKAELQLSRNTEASLQKQITRLQSDLKQGTKQGTKPGTSSSDKGGQKQVTDLEASLKQEKAEVQKLKKELKKTDTINAELAEAKKTILKLADTNSGKEQELRKKVTALQTDLKKEKAVVQALKKELKQAEKVKAELEKANAKIDQLSKSGTKSPSKLMGTKPSPLATNKEGRFLTPKYKTLRRASMTPGAAQSENLSNSDIGWYD